MKKRLTILCILIITILLCSCRSEKAKITYKENFSTIKAEQLFKEERYDEFTDLCKTISGNNDDPENRDNFFNYVAVHFADVDKSNNEKQFEPSLSIISECLKLPLTQQSVISSLKASYASMDGKLIENSKDYILGKWQRRDSTDLSNMVMEIQNDENGNLIGKIVSVPDADVTTFKTGDIKWKDIYFANYETVYLSDRANSEINIETYYKKDGKTISSFKGAIAKINFDSDIMTLTYDSSIQDYETITEQDVQTQTPEENPDQTTDENVQDDEQTDSSDGENEISQPEKTNNTKQLWVKLD